MVSSSWRKGYPLLPRISDSRGNIIISARPNCNKIALDHF